MSKNKWSIEFINETAEKEVLKLSPDLQAKFIRIGDLLAEFGPHHIGMPHSRFLQQGLWEIRMKGKDNIARSIYCLQKGQKIVILHTFIKKTQKAPQKAITVALKRLKEELK